MVECQKLPVDVRSGIRTYGLISQIEGNMGYSTFDWYFSFSNDSFRQKSKTEIKWNINEVLRDFDNIRSRF